MHLVPDADGTDDNIEYLGDNIGYIRAVEGGGQFHFRHVRLSRLQPDVRGIHPLST